MQKQDLNGYRTPLDVARRYRLGDIELNTLEIEELASKIVTDSALSTTSEHPVQNKVITSALNNKANISSIPTKTSDLINDSDFVDSAELEGKQDKLTAGANITIANNVISSTGGGTEYSTSEIIIGTWIDNRPIYRKVIDCGSLPNTTTKTVAHGISNLSFVTSISGTASNGVDKIPLPFLDVNNVIYGVMVWVNSTNINIACGDNKSNYTKSYVTLEYLKTTD